MIDFLNDEKLDNSLKLSLRGKYDEATQILKSANQSDPRVKFNMGWYYLRNGNMSEGYENMDFGRHVNVFGGAKNHLSPTYQNQSLREKTLLFYGEGGFGDEIINIRFVKNFYEMGAKIIVGCSKELFCIFEKIPYITSLIDRDMCIHSHHDYWIPAMSSPKYLKMEYENLDGSPYLNYFNKRWVPKNNSKLKVGLKWSGNPKFEHQQYRKFPLEKILNLANTKNATFYSLQRDEDFIESNSIIDLRYEMKTWKDTAEIVASMDIIITSCTSIAHLSAAMGKQTWVIVPILPYYIWAIPENTSPWYNTVKIYRQEAFENWDAPFEKITQDLLKISNGI